jgi:hypothetical protein
VRIGSISQGKNKCDNCGHTIRYAERYLIIKEKDGVEDDNGEIRYYCVKCASEKHYVQSRNDKGEHIITFFKEIEKPIAQKAEDEVAANKEIREPRTTLKKANEEEQNTEE